MRPIEPPRRLRHGGEDESDANRPDRGDDSRGVAAMPEGADRFVGGFGDRAGIEGDVAAVLQDAGTGNREGFERFFADDVIYTRNTGW